jgi:hypothetical protein
VGSNNLLIRQDMPVSVRTPGPTTTSRLNNSCFRTDLFRQLLTILEGVWLTFQIVDVMTFALILGLLIRQIRELRRKRDLQASQQVIPVNAVVGQDLPE